MNNLPVKTITLPTPFDVGTVNSYLITADPVTIIDPGLYYESSEETLKLALEDNGLGISDIRRVVITHGHPDHYGLAGKIQRESGAEILARDEEAGKMMPDRDFIDKLVQALTSTGMEEDILNLNWNVVFGGKVPYTHAIEDITTYHDEPFLDFSGFSLQLLHMPGHSGGHTCLYWPGEGLLLSGDVLLPEITSVPAIEFDPRANNRRRRSMSDIIRSMERVQSLNAGLCLPGHGGPITEPGALAKSRVEFHRNRLEEILELVPRGVQNALTPYQLSRIYYPDVKGFDKFLAVIEVVAHLDFLADEGRITEQLSDDGVSFFFRNLN